MNQVYFDLLQQQLLTILRHSLLLVIDNYYKVHIQSSFQIASPVISATEVQKACDSIEYSMGKTMTKIATVNGRRTRLHSTNVKVSFSKFIPINN